MGEDTDDYFAKARRENRWRALHEDEDVFGLVAAEYEELAILDKEFGPFGKEAGEP